ncbi:MAG: AAA family ATPase, partial [Planctomycetaceae bacterium]
TLRFLAMIAALLGPDPAKFYFLEEIDNGIHPTRLALLLQLIEQQARDGKVQIVTTTHSPQLLGMLSPAAREHASLVYRNPGEQQGHIRRVLDIPAARALLAEQNLARLHESGWLEDAVAFETAEPVP